MPTTSESVRKLILAHTKGDEDAFLIAVRELIADEHRKNHPVFARELERILAAVETSRAGPPQHGRLTSLPWRTDDLPRDAERDTTLVEVQEPRRDLSSLVLATSVRKVLDRITQENREGDLLRSFGLGPIGKVLFCGPPGCGKTVAAEAIARELYLPLAVVRFDAVVSSYLGETSSNLRRVFDFAYTRQVVLLFDEFDAIGKKRASTEEHDELKRVVSSFLQLLDAFHGESVIIAATNHQGLLDPALWRRFDEIVLFPLPDSHEIEAMLIASLRQIGMSRDINVRKISQLLAGMSHADVEHVALEAVKRTLLSRGATVDLTTLEQAVCRQRVRWGLTGAGSDIYAASAPIDHARGSNDEHDG